ncbi:hypothetical protein BC826DRAFT_1068942 [Russula brevipes]|nr:hypothetical protein BC826DRAFT_1068942 [Russula brevipes]
MVGEASRMPFPSFTGKSLYTKVCLTCPSPGLYSYEVFKASGADIIVSVGSGSPTDASKAITFLHEEFGRQFLRYTNDAREKDRCEPTVPRAVWRQPRRGTRACYNPKGFGQSLLIFMNDRVSQGRQAIYWDPGPYRAVEALYRPYVVPPLKVICYGPLWIVELPAPVEGELQ